MNRLRTSNVSAIALLLANIILPISQYNIASTFSLMGPDFNQNVSGLGLLGAVLFLGIAVSEVPGSIIAMRVGPKKVVIGGALLSSLPVLLSSFSSSFTLIVLSRFLLGAGLGACFSPLVTLVIRNIRRGSTGLGLGLIVLTYNVGGIIGLFGWAVLGDLVGWRSSLLMSGGLGLLATFVLLIILPRDEVVRSHISARALGRVLFNRKIVVLTVALFGIGGASTLTFNFVVFYLESSIGVRPDLAGLIGSLAPAFALMAPFVGRWYDRDKNTAKWIGFAIITMVVGLALTSLGSIVFVILSVALVGMGSSVGYSVVLTAARETAGSDSEYGTLAVGWADGTSLTGGFVTPIFFSAIVLQYGYSAAWLFGSFFVLVFALPFLHQASHKMERSSMG